MHNSLLHLILKIGDFLNTHISQGSVATRLGCGGVFVYDCYKLHTESNSERILKIGRYLVKLWARERCLVFLTHGVVYFAIEKIHKIQQEAHLSPRDRAMCRVS